MKAVRIYEFGGTEVMKFEEVAKPTPQRGQALVKLHAIGLNFIDTYIRSGLYKEALPITLGKEGSGIVEAVGEGVTEVSVGDRVAFATGSASYAEYAAINSSQLVKIPDALSFEEGAAAMLQGLTAHYLCTSTYPVKAGDSALVHAASGGVGRLLVQMCKMKGARVLGTVSTEDKAAEARAVGCDEVVLYNTQDFEAAAKRFTDGRGMNAVYDSVGLDTWEKSLNSLAPLGFLVFFGQSSGKVPPFDPLLLSKGSYSVCRPTLGHYVQPRSELLRRSEELFGWITSGKLKLLIGATFPLSEAAAAHAALEGRKTKGKVVLTV